MSTRRRRLRPLDLQKGIAEGVASLDSDGKVRPEQLPAVLSNTTFEQVTIREGNVLRPINMNQQWHSVEVPHGVWTKAQWIPQKGLFICIHGLKFNSSGSFIFGGTPSDFIQVPSKEYRIMTSFDGVNWVPRFTERNEDIHCVTFSPELNLFVAFGMNQSVYHSSDGINWTLRKDVMETIDALIPENFAYRNFDATGLRYTIQDIIWVPDLYPDTPNPGRFIATGIKQVVIMSSDGVTWTFHPTSNPYGGYYPNLNRVYWLASVRRLFILQDQGETFWSSDGVTWEYGDYALYGDFANGTDLAFDPVNNRYLATGYTRSNFQTTQYFIVSSLDGITWTKETSSYPPGVRGVFRFFWMPEINRFVGSALGTSSEFQTTKIVTSVDGLNWVGHDVLPFMSWTGGIAYSPQLRTIIVTSEQEANIQPIICRTDFDDFILQGRVQDNTAPSTLTLFPEALLLDQSIITPSMMTSNIVVSANAFVSGSLGLGTLVPDSKLHIREGTVRIEATPFLSAPTAPVSVVQLKDATTTNAFFMGAGFGADKKMYFGASNVGTLAVSDVKMTMDMSGNVGIGVIAPTSKLHVAGSTFLDGNVVISGTVTNSSGQPIAGGSGGITADSVQPRFRVEDNSNTAAVIVNQAGAGNIIELRDANAVSVVVKDGGNVGLGTATPSTRLHVVGKTTLEGEADVRTAADMFYLQTAEGVRWKRQADERIHLNSGTDMILRLNSDSHPFVNDPGFNASVFSLLQEATTNFPTFHAGGYILVRSTPPGYRNIGVVFEPQPDGGVRIRSAFDNNYYGYNAGDDAIMQFYPGDSRIQTWYVVPITYKGSVRVQCAELRTTGRAAVDQNGTAAALSVNQNGTGSILELLDSNVTVMTVKDGGNVGIGVANPTSKLHVAGSTFLDGNVVISGNVTNSSGQPIAGGGITADSVQPRFQVSDNSASTALIVNQAGTGKIVELRDSATPVVTVKDGGLVGVGARFHSDRLHVLGKSVMEGDMLVGGVRRFFLQSADGRRWKRSAGIRLSLNNGSGNDLQLILNRETHPLVNNAGFQPDIFGLLMDATNNHPIYHEQAYVIVRDTYPGYADFGVVFEPQAGGGIRIRMAHNNWYVGYDAGQDRIIIYPNGNANIITWFLVPIDYKGSMVVQSNDLTVNGTSRFDVNNSNTALIVNQAGTGNIVELRDSNSPVVTVMDGGNVGIGLTNPTSKLHVGGDIRSSGAIVGFYAIFPAVHDVFYGTVPEPFQMSQAATPLPQLVYDPATYTFTAQTTGRFTFTIDFWAVSAYGHEATWYIEVTSIGLGRTKKSTNVAHLGSTAVWGYAGDTFRVMVSWSASTQVYLSPHGTKMMVQYN